MKRILLVFAICYCSISMFAEHPVVLGVNLGEVTATEFKSILREKGWALADGSSGNMYEGTFAGYSGSQLLISSSDKTNKIAKVVIYLPKKSSWSSLKRNYEDLQSTYEAKYGATKNNFHFFSKPYYEGDGYEMLAVKSEKCYYACIWELDGYFISVEISKYQQVKITYEDTEILNEIKYERQVQAASDI